MLVEADSLDENALLHMHLEFLHDELVVPRKVFLADVCDLGDC